MGCRNRRTAVILKGTDWANDARFSRDGQKVVTASHGHTAMIYIIVPANDVEKLFAALN